MVLLCYFFLLLVLSVEDYNYHRVRACWFPVLFILGCVQVYVRQDNRWVTVALTCICFLLLYLLYRLAKAPAGLFRGRLPFGGADVRLIPCMMLVQGWDTALSGVFLGLLAAVIYYLPMGKRHKEIPLIPWMSAGCFIIELAVTVQRAL